MKVNLRGCANDHEMGWERREEKKKPKSPRPETRNLLPLLTWGKKENGFRGHSLFPFTKRGTFKAVSENVLGSLEAFSKRGCWEGFAKFWGHQLGACPPRGQLGRSRSYLFAPHPWGVCTMMCMCVCVCTGVHCIHVSSTHTGDIYLHRCVYHRVLIKRFTCWWVLPKTWPVGLCSVVPCKWLYSANSFKWCWCKWLCMWKGAFAWGVGAVYLVDRQCPRK